jgi:hypothetical protein
MSDLKLPINSDLCTGASRDLIPKVIILSPHVLENRLLLDLIIIWGLRGGYYTHDSR